MLPSVARNDKPRMNCSGVVGAFDYRVDVSVRDESRFMAGD